MYATRLHFRSSFSVQKSCTICFFGRDRMTVELL